MGTSALFSNMASTASVVLEEVIHEINMANPLVIQNSYLTDGDSTEELHRDLLDSPDADKSTENGENIDLESGMNLQILSNSR